MATTLSSLSADLAALVAGAAPRLVGVGGAEGSIASGLVWRTGLVVSAHEALGGEEEFTVRFADGSAKAAEVLGRDPATDVVLLKVETVAFEAWTPAAIPAAGSLAVITGRGEQSPSAGLAMVSEVGPAWRSMRGGLIDARITLGIRLSARTEGGAVLSPDGGFIGMAVSGPRRRALAIPASTIARAVEILSEKGYVPKGYLGVSLHPVGDGGGAIVVALESEGPAKKAGFLVGDIITTWGDEPVRSVTGVSNRLSAETVGRTVKLGVLRGGSPIDINVDVAERPRA